MNVIQNFKSPLVTVFPDVKGKSFHRFMKFIINGVGLAIPIVFGYWRYRTTSEPNPVADGIWIGFLSTFFSLGLWLSSTELGRKLKYLTLLLILIGALVHIIFSVYPLFFIPIVVSVEIYAACSLFRKTTL